jgi:excisionase family DNA binding protein
MTRPTKPPSIPRYHALKTVADRLDLSPRSVQRLIGKGVLPAIKIGGVVRVSDDDLLALIARCRQAKPLED